MADVERVRASEQAQRLFQVRKTVTEMLVARGYIVPQDEIDETLETFKAKFGENPSRGASQLRLHKKADSNEQILVFFPDKDKVGAQEIQECALRCPCPHPRHLNSLFSFSLPGICYFTVCGI